MARVVVEFDGFIIVDVPDGLDDYERDDVLYGATTSLRAEAEKHGGDFYITSEYEVAEDE